MEKLFFVSFLVGFFFIILENIFPKRSVSKKKQLNSYKTNILVFTFNNVIFYILILRTLYFFAQNYSQYGLFNFLPEGLFKFIFLLIFLDLIIYFWHRANHEFSYLWLFHKTHHSDISLNTTTAIRFHIGELFLSLLVKVTIIVIFGIPANVILVSESLTTVFSFFHHSNISFKLEKKLSKVIIVPFLHEVHHSSKRIEHDSNYGVIFSFWDKIFRTQRLSIKNPIGLDGVKELDFLKFIKFGFTKKY